MYTRERAEMILHWTGTQEDSSTSNTSSAVEVYKSMFDDSPQPMWIYDKATLQFLDVNEAAIAHYA